MFVMYFCCVVSTVFPRCMNVKCGFAYFLCVLLGFHLFVGWYWVFVLLLIFGFILYIFRIFICPVLVMMIGLDRVCITFLDFLGVKEGYG